ncbi:MAG: hypothetical protein LBE08_02845 [Bifidobacteriaceae bacterium]|jgi:hypothetical protein|nr:hypothetical protein [Bifidobacteriaceae bacterium]
MTALRVELRKALAGRTFTWAIIAALALVGFMALVPALISTSGDITEYVTESNGLKTLAEPLRSYLYSAAARVGYVVPFVLGSLAVGVEWREHTMGRSIIGAGGPSGLVVAKVVTVGLQSAGIGVLVSLVDGGLVAAVLHGRGLDAGLGDSAVQGILVRTPLVFLVWGIIGVGLALIIRSQAANLAVVFAFFLFIEPTLTNLANESPSFSGIGRFLPGAASLSLAWPPESSGPAQTTGGVTAALSWPAGGAVLLGYAALVVLIGYLVRFRRMDIDA